MLICRSVSLRETSYYWVPLYSILRNWEHEIGKGSKLCFRHTAWFETIYTLQSILYCLEYILRSFLSEPSLTRCVMIMGVRSAPNHTQADTSWHIFELPLICRLVLQCGSWSPVLTSLASYSCLGCRNLLSTPLPTALLWHYRWVSFEIYLPFCLKLNHMQISLGERFHFNTSASLRWNVLLLLSICSSLTFSSPFRSM